MHKIAAVIYTLVEPPRRIGNRLSRGAWTISPLAFFFV